MHSTSLNAGDQLPALIYVMNKTPVKKNAIFANKKISRKIKSLVIVNPHLEKHTREDKLSILDIRAQLADNTTILVEMHLYDLEDMS